MLTFSDLKDDLYRMVGTKSNSARSDVLAAVTTAIRRAQECFVNYGDWSFLEQLTDVVYIPLGVPYSTGTVTISQDSKSVAGTTTAWTDSMEGDFLVVDSGTSYEIQNVTAAGALTLCIPYQGDSVTDESYKIYRKHYSLPLNFVRPFGREIKLQNADGSGECILSHSDDTTAFDRITEGKPSRYSIRGNMRRNAYYSTGTVTISGTTWTVSTGTLPTDIVDREVRVAGETNAYRISARTGNTTFTTYQTYYNPTTQLTTQTTASSYSITPTETKVISVNPISPDTRYIITLPYIKRINEMISETEISPIVMAGYEDAFLTMCRQKLAEDGRVAMRADLVANLIAAGQNALANAWTQEQMAQTHQRQGAVRRFEPQQIGPSWISR